jgi:hypothetical protein
VVRAEPETLPRADRRGPEFQICGFPLRRWIHERRHADRPASADQAGDQVSREPIGDPFGYPLRLRTATKLGFKNPKWITAIEVTNLYPGGYWEGRGYNWFSGH